MNTFDDDNEPGLFEEPPKRPPRERARRPQRSTPRRTGPSAGSNGTLRLAGLIALGIAIVVGLVLWIGSCSSQSEGYAAYIDAMRPLAQDSASVGAKFASALGTPGLTMESFESDLDDWKQQEQQDYVKAQRLQPPGPLQSAHAQALATFQLRYNSLDRLANTLTVAQQGHAGPAVVASALASDAQLLSASDTVWAELFKLAATQTLAARDIGDVIVPGSRIVTNPDIVSASQLATVYQRLRTPSNGQGKHGSTLLSTNAVENGVTTQLSETATTTVKFGGNGVINVVFQNSGSFPEVRVPVTLAITVDGESVSTQTKTVSQIAAGAQATVSFTQIEVPQSAYSQSAAIYVKIARVPKEKQLGDNAASYPIFIRLAST